MLDKVKMALQIATNLFDDEINASIETAKKDLGLGGVSNDDQDDALVCRAIISYCAYQFELLHGNLTRADKLKIAYDEQKSQLGMASGYTEWSFDE